MRAGEVAQPARRQVDVCDAAGITYRQLQYWSERGFFGEHNRNLGSGSRRSFTEGDVRVMRAIGRLSRSVGLAGSGGPGDTRCALKRKLADIVGLIRAGVEGEYEIKPGVVLDLGVLARPLDEGELS